MEKSKKKAFTLVELLVVIAIIAILATVSIVGYSSFISRARKSNAQTEAAQAKEVIIAEVISDPSGKRNVEGEGTYFTYVKGKLEIGGGKGSSDFNGNLKNEFTDLSDLPGTFSYDGKDLIYTTDNEVENFDVNVITGDVKENSESGGGEEGGGEDTKSYTITFKIGVVNYANGWNQPMYGYSGGFGTSNVDNNNPSKQDKTIDDGEAIQIYAEHVSPQSQWVNTHVWNVKIKDGANQNADTTLISFCYNGQNCSVFSASTNAAISTNRNTPTTVSGAATFVFACKDYENGKWYEDMPK